MEDYQREGEEEAMKRLQEYYEFYLREEPEAPADAEFGQYAFAPNRTDVPTPKEPNTDEEDETSQAISDYLGNNAKKNLDKKSGLLLSLARRGLYKKVLDPKMYSKAWRLMRLPSREMPLLMGKSLEELGASGVVGPGMLAPKGAKVSGWTVAPGVLLKDLPNFGNGNAFVVFVASIKGNKFFGNPGELAKAAGVPEVEEEMETIAVGTVQYDKCSYVIFDPASMANDEFRKSAMYLALNKVL